ncbi:MAG: ribosomal protein methyltransferase [Thermoleophilia bacterium]|nr:ribosomal protein methyltransferase [Thermoleophilia bacterium]
MSEHPELPPTTTTAEARDELFGVHIPELQLPLADYRAGLGAAGLAAGEYYLELGSGHGHGLVIAAREFEADAHGVEYLEDAITTALARAVKAGVVDRVDIVRDDVRRTSFAPADVVHMHLGPAFHDVLAERLEQQLTPNARVVAAGWQVPGWLPLPSALEAWDAGYVYRPADPRWQVSWGAVEPLAADALDQPAHTVAVNVHADLAAIEVRIDGADAPDAEAVVSSARAGRGQQVHVAWSAPEGARFELALWARSRNGRFTQRGSTFTPDAGLDEA